MPTGTASSMGVLNRVAKVSMTHGCVGETLPRGCRRAKLTDDQHARFDVESQPELNSRDILQDVAQWMGVLNWLLSIGCHVEGEFSLHLDLLALEVFCLKLETSRDIRSTQSTLVIGE